MFLETCLKLIIAVFAVYLFLRIITAPFRLAIEFFYVFKVSGIKVSTFADFLEKHPQSERGRVCGTYITDALVVKVQELCIRGEEISEHLIVEFGYDYRYKLCQRKLAFLKGRPDLIRKYKRLPDRYAYRMSENKAWAFCTREFERDWIETYNALFILRKWYGYGKYGRWWFLKII